MAAISSHALLEVIPVDFNCLLANSDGYSRNFLPDSFLKSCYSVTEWGWCLNTFSLKYPQRKKWQMPKSGECAGHSSNVPLEETRRSGSNCCSFVVEPEFEELSESNNLGYIWLQQDGATVHTIRISMTELRLMRLVF